MTSSSDVESEIEQSLGHSLRMVKYLSVLVLILSLGLVLGFLFIGAEALNNSHRITELRHSVDQQEVQIQHLQDRVTRLEHGG